MDDTVSQGEKENDAEPSEEQKKSCADRLMHETEKNDERSINACAGKKRFHADDARSLRGRQIKRQYKRRGIRVKGNIDRFPEDFMSQLTKNENN